MIEDIVLFTRSLLDLDFWRGRTNGRTKVFQEVLADLKKKKYAEVVQLFIATVLGVSKADVL